MCFCGIFSSWKRIQMILSNYQKILYVCWRWLFKDTYFLILHGNSFFHSIGSHILSFVSSSNWPIDFKKGTWSTCNPYLIYNFLSYHHLSLSYFFIFALSTTLVPKTICEALKHPRWRQAMIMKCKLLKTIACGSLFLFPRK